MDNKQKYEGKRIDIYSPSGRKIDTLKVTEVIDETYLYGESEISKITTTYDLDDGIKVEIVVS